MKKAFTTPNIVQKYLAEPITYRFISQLKELCPNPIFSEGCGSILLIKDERVVDCLRGIMRSYKGFKLHRNGDSYTWIHPMKSTSNYVGNMLVISLTNDGDLYRFSTHIVLGKKKRNCYVMTTFGYLSALSILLLAGFVGGFGFNLLTWRELIIRAVLCIAGSIVFGLLESKFNPVFHSGKR